MGYDYIDTKFVSLFSIFAISMKIFTFGKPYIWASYMVYAFSIFLSLILIYGIIYKLKFTKWQKIAVLFSFNIFYCHIIDLNSEIIVNVFLLLAVYLFIKSDKEYGGGRTRWFFVGFAIGIGSFLRLPAIVNYATFPLIYFILQYKREENFIKNIILNIQENYQKYILFSIGVFLPWILYFTYCAFTSFQPFLNYINHLSNYSKINQHIEKFYLKIIWKLNILAIISIFFAFKKDKIIGIIFSLYVVINYIFGYLPLSAHFNHYLFQIIIVYPIIIGFVIPFFISYIRHNISIKKIILIFIVIFLSFHTIFTGFFYIKKSFKKHLNLIKYAYSKNNYSYKFLIKSQNITDEYNTGKKYKKDEFFLLNILENIISGYNKVLLLNARKVELSYLNIINYTYRIADNVFLSKKDYNIHTSSYYKNHGYPEIIILNSRGKKKYWNEGSFFQEELFKSNYYNKYNKKEKLILLPSGKKSKLTIWKNKY